MYIQLKAQCFTSQYFSTNKQFPLHIKGHICVQFPYGKKYYIYLLKLITVKADQVYPVC